MAEKAYIKEKQSKFGTFATSTGGGEPIAKGKKWTNEKRDPDQPRTSDGKFTYNAVNGKPLKDISKSHNESRGTTIPPTLTGGVNGVRYYKGKEDKNGHVTRDFEGGRVYDADERASRATGMSIEEIYKKGDSIVTFDGKIKTATRDMIESAMEFVANKGAEGKLTGALAEAKDAKTKEEKEAIAEKILSSGHFAGDITSEWGPAHEATTEKEKAAVAKAEEEGTKGKEMVEREPEVKEEKTPDVTKSETRTPVAPSAGTGERAPAESTVSAAPTAPEAKYTPEQLKEIGDKLGLGDVKSDELEELIASGDITESDIADAIKEEEAPAEKPAESVEEAKEELGDEFTKEDAMKFFNDPENKGARDELLADAKKVFGKEVEGLTDKAIIEMYLDEEFGGK